MLRNAAGDHELGACAHKNMLVLINFPLVIMAVLHVIMELSNLIMELLRALIESNWSFAG
ncbi:MULTISPECIES: hypothetical protein [unclassified Sporosarcina]|uniref:hypothetical protein n=1 Tax=unclassified Sporosarcina TaxID=2647733 RepID=UPI00203DFD02|nr:MULTISPECIES: hypothetical protein [unclassified Sporosarcina]GKV64029.1 hypothetical protein NCCP2331_01820 [Sporosarcina sp. NCCP-2331]GLB56397.1 hypothetical protein NCCP2378_21840 [Sporosarcina sp. NCCP-2378]